MTYRDRCRHDRGATRRALRSGAPGLLLLLLAALAAVAPARAQQQRPPQPPQPPQPARAGTARAVLALRGVTVIDVTDGRLLPEQTVVITGPRITRVGPMRTVPLPPGTQVVDARGKYLIPGLWDMHYHISSVLPLADRMPAMRAEYTLLLANGVTGIRDAGTAVPLDSLRAWRRAILAGGRVGPPRQLLAGRSLNQRPGRPGTDHLRVVPTMADVLHAVDSLRAAGADHIKLHELGPALQDSAVAELRQRGVLFGGHYMRAGDGARFADHGWAPLTSPASASAPAAALPRTSDGIRQDGCVGDSATFERCERVAERMRQSDLWLVVNPLADQQLAGYYAMRQLSDAQLRRLQAPAVRSLMANDFEAVRDQWALVGRAGVPLLVGTDYDLWAAGFGLHDAIASLVWRGITPLQALQAATLNPARALHATDSLGTVAAGKLADLVLLDGNPLSLIQNTTMIRAVVANGRYYDRAALDRLLAAVDYEPFLRSRGAAP